MGSTSQSINHLNPPNAFLTSNTTKIQQTFVYASRTMGNRLCDQWRWNSANDSAKQIALPSAAGRPQVWSPFSHSFCFLELLHLYIHYTHTHHIPAMTARHLLIDFESIRLCENGNVFNVIVLRLCFCVHTESNSICILMDDPLILICRLPCRAQWRITLPSRKSSTSSTVKWVFNFVFVSIDCYTHCSVYGRFGMMWTETYCV